MRVSVVMPYYNNQRTLLRSLRSFAAQTHRPEEIIVVDDGSAHPAGDVVREGHVAGVPLRVMRAPHGGQSAATNVGIRAALGEVVFLSCPDIVAPRGVLARHVAAHEVQGDVGVMGHISYAPWLKATPFLRYLSRPGPQFRYDTIRDAYDADPDRLYAPACSVPRARLLAVGGFDEVFTYGYQDTDLGLRLAASGLRFVYDARAVVLHDHPNDLAAFCRRTERVASLTWHMLDKHPTVLPAAELVAGLRAWRASVHLVPKVREQIAWLEGEARRLPGRPSPQQRELEQLYDGLLTLSFSCGLLRGGEAVRTRLGVSPRAWAELETTLLPLSESALASGGGRSKGDERLHEVDVHRHRPAQAAGIAAAER